MQFLCKILRQNKMLCQPIIPSFFSELIPETLKHTYFFFFWPNLIRAETRSTHILILPLQKQNFPTIKLQCVTVIYINIYNHNVYAVFVFKELIAPRPPPQNKQTNKKTHYPVCVTYLYSGQTEMFYGF